MILNLILFFMFIGAMASAIGGGASETMPIVQANSILKIDLSQNIRERTQEGMSSDFNSLPFLNVPQSSLGIYDAIRAIEKAATDKNISMILITQKNGANGSFANLEELRNALLKFHESGKPIISYGINYSLGGYYIASVADKIFIHTDGMVSINGLGGNMMFYKDLLDKLGISFQLIRHGKFKSAAEQYIKNDISPENRQQNQEMLNSIWQSWAEQICKSRNLTLETLNNAIDNLQIGDAQSALALNLVDSVFTSEKYTGKICSLVGVEKEEDLKVVNLSTYAKSATLPYKGNVKVAVLYAEGEIGMTTGGISAVKFVQQIKKIRKDKTINAVVLRVNSPGGDAQAAELIREELQSLAAQLPVVCSFGEYAASGGYWISAQTKRIFSDATTLTGSIGVFSLALNYGKGLKEHLKINNVAIGTHKHSTMGSGIQPLSEEEMAYTQKFIEHIYDKFMGIVSDGRKMSIAQVDSIAQGRVWTGEQGVKVGIVDEIGGIEDAIKYAASLAADKEGVDAENLQYKVVEFPKVKTQFELFMEAFGNSSGEDTKLAKVLKTLNIDKEVQTTELEALITQIKNSNGIRAYARIPYTYKFNY